MRKLESPTFLGRSLNPIVALMLFRFDVIAVLRGARVKADLVTYVETRETLRGG